MFRPALLIVFGISAGAAEEAAKVVSVALSPPPLAIAPVENPDARGTPVPRTTVWKIGGPTDEEQYYLELMNRSRANPTAEGLRLANTTDPDVSTTYSYFNVNLTQLKAEMSALVVAPPLAMNAKLLQASRAHSEDQFTNVFQGHEGSNGSHISDRLAAVGYSSSYYAENVYAYSKSTWFGHAGFEVDWGYGSGGMQDGRGHRAIIHAGFREVGIGIRDGANGSGTGAVGPQIVTQDFGIAAGVTTPFVTGVAYYDFNGNAFYDPGEGIGGVTVNVEGAGYHAVTEASGGYAVPVPEGAAIRIVNFTGLGINSTAAAILTGTNNTKVDLVPAYMPPLVNGSASPLVGTGNNYSVTTVGGASAYDCRMMRKTFAVTDGANDLTRINPSVSGYSAVTTGSEQEGTGSYHLAQPVGRNETITYKATFRGLTAPVLRYQSRLAAATNKQRAYVQISTDNGITWTTVDSQSGSGGSGQSGFNLRTVTLPSLAGRDFLLRFSFTLAGTSFFPSTNDNTGWFIDAISFTDILDTTGAVVTGISSGNAFTFTPATAGTWVLFGCPVISGRPREFGPALEVTAVTAPPLPEFRLWASGFESSAGLPAGTIAGSAASDHNNDGVANLMAYALDLSPVAPSSAALPWPVAAGGALRLDYPRRTDRPDVRVTPEISTNLQTWFTPGQTGAPAGFTDAVFSTSGNIETRRASVPFQTGKRYWLRLRAVKL